MITPIIIRALVGMFLNEGRLIFSTTATAYGIEIKPLNTSHKYIRSSSMNFE